LRRVNSLIAIKKKPERVTLANILLEPQKEQKAGTSEQIKRKEWELSSIEGKVEK